MSEFVMDSEWAEMLQRDVAEYMDALQDSVWDEEESEYGEAETLTGIPYCGCDTCFWREALYFTTQRVLEGQKAGKLELLEEE